MTFVTQGDDWDFRHTLCAVVFRDTYIVQICLSEFPCSSDFRHTWLVGGALVALKSCADFRHI
jgi:hypothetical protein